MKPILQQIEREIEARFAGDSSGHDLHHLRRVLRVALHLQEQEGGDRLVVAAAALLHDVHRIIETETGTFCPPKDSLPAVRDILERTDFPAEKIERVLHCVEFHEEYSFSPDGRTVDDVETLILQDADNLDALGAIGIGRTFAFGGAHGVPMHAPGLPFDRPHYDEAERDPSVLHHFHSKLLRLRESMNTEAGRALAARRHAFMEAFVEEFVEEWAGRR